MLFLGVQKLVWDNTIQNYIYLQHALHPPKVLKYKLMKPRGNSSMYGAVEEKEAIYRICDMIFHYED